MRRKGLPIGNDDFSDIRRSSSYYVDKTLMIKEFIEIAGIEGLDLQQILANQYYTGITGEVICVGLVHNKKRCSLASKILNVPQ